MTAHTVGQGRPGSASTRSARSPGASMPRSSRPAASAPPAVTSRTATGRSASPSEASRIRIVAAGPVESNAVFVTLPGSVAGRLREDYSFSTWDPDLGVVRLMTSFDTRESDIDEFTAACRAALAEVA